MSYQEATIRQAYISLTKFIDSRIDAEVLNERNELHLLFSNWRTNNNFSHRWTIENPNYYIKRGAEMINIDKEVKKDITNCEIHRPSAEWIIESFNTDKR